MAAVLLVDDEPLVLKVFGRVLRRRGIDVDLAGGGAAALELLRTKRYALVISDVTMPGMSGTDLLAEASRAGLHQGPFVFLTGHAGDRRSELIELGAHAVLDKPVSRDHFMANVHEYLGMAAVLP